MPRKPKFEKLQISCLRRGEMQFETAYDARDAAKRATRRAKAGWSVKVSARGPRALMECKPAAKNGKAFASCTMTPAFKKRSAGR